jgi:hypothetical protein
MNFATTIRRELSRARCFEFRIMNITLGVLQTAVHNSRSRRPLQFCPFHVLLRHCSSRGGASGRCASPGSFGKNMPSRDYMEFSTQLPALVGRKCFLTLATNSVKLHLDENRKGGTFLWIDPPWQFGRAGEIIESSASCPHYEEEHYERKFRAWCSKFAPVGECVIEKIEASSDGTLWVHLGDGYAFFVPKEFIPDDPLSWYDHWYLRKAEPNTY